MARAKRMGAYNALDDLLPGPAWDLSAAEPAAEPAPPDGRGCSRFPTRRGPGAARGAGPAPWTSCSPARGAPTGSTTCFPGRRRRRPGGSGWRHGAGAPAGGTLGSGTRSTGRRPRPSRPVPVPVPVKARVSFRLPADLVETARDAVAHLAGSADRTTLTALTERALRVELARLAITHNHGQPFPPRDP